MRKKIYLLGSTLVSVLFLACNNKDIEASSSLPPVNKVIDPRGLVHEVKIDNIENEIVSSSVTMTFTYDEDNRLSKVTNFHGKTLLYQYLDNQIIIKEKNEDTEHSYLLYKCKINNALVEEISYTSTGYVPEIVGKYILKYDANGRLLSELRTNPNESQINYVWNNKGDAIIAQEKGFSYQNFKSLEIPNTANIDFSTIVGAYPNSIPLQMIAIIKHLGSPNKEIIVDADSRQYTTKMDDQNA